MTRPCVLWAAIAMLSLAPGLSAQGRSTIDGFVTAGGRAIGDVSIEIRRGDELVATGSTQPDGRISLGFRGSDSDTYQVRLQSSVFGTRTLEVGQARRNATLTEANLDLVIELHLVGLATAMPPPPTPPSSGFPTGGRSGSPAPSGDNHAIVKVFFATDRARTDAVEIEFGPGRNAGGKLRLGRFDVSVPRDHRMGTFERPTVLTFWREDPDRHFIIVRRTEHTYDQFYGEVSSVVAQSRGKAAFVFVHGYNVPFESAVYRTAQLSYDLGFDGASILYSWPSTGSEVGYPVDANNSQWSVPHLRWFLEDVSAKTGAQTIHLIAHSMGNQPLIRALSEMYTTTRTGGTRPKFKQIALTAPDIDADTFRQLAVAVTAAAERVTLYASSGDLALKLSRKYQGYQRAGDSLPQVLVLPGVDTIDVSALDTGLLGHSYYGDNRSVLADLFGLIKDGLAPGTRFGLHEAGSPTNRWWVFQP